MYYLAFITLLISQSSKPHEPHFSTTDPKETVEHLAMLNRMAITIHKIAAESGNHIDKESRIKAIQSVAGSYSGLHVEWPLLVQSVTSDGIHLQETKTIILQDKGKPTKLNHSGEWSKKLKRGDLVVVKALITECKLASLDSSVPAKIILDDITIEKYVPKPKKN